MMKNKILLIAIISVISTALFNVVDAVIPDRHAGTLQQTLAEYVHDYHITGTEQNILTPRQSDPVFNSQSRTIAKRSSTQRNSNRYVFYISGRAVGTCFIKSYQQTAGLFPTGLCETQSFFISLCKLII